MNIHRFIDQTLREGSSSHSLNLGKTIHETTGSVVNKGYTMHCEYHMIPANHYTLEDIVNTYIKAWAEMLSDDDTFLTSDIHAGMLKISTYKIINQ